jgi:hypothetical protein
VQLRVWVCGGRLEMGAMKRLAGMAEMGSQQTEFNLPIRLQIELFVGRNDIFCTEGLPVVVVYAPSR